MKKDISGYIDWLKRRKAVRNRNIALFIILSFIISGNTFWMLRGVGTALTDDEITTKETEITEVQGDETPAPGSENNGEGNEDDVTAPDDEASEPGAEKPSDEEKDEEKEEPKEESEEPNKEPEKTKEEPEEPKKESGEQTPEESQETVSFTAKTSSGIIVNAKAPAGTFPEGTTMTAEDVEDEFEINNPDLIDEAKEIKGMIAVDIVFENKDGGKIEPPEGSKVSVSIVVPEDKKLEGEDFMLLHVEEDGVKNVEDAEVNAEEAKFTTDSFSIYVMTALGEKEKDKVNEWLDGFGFAKNEFGCIDNTEDHPYYLAVGDKVTIIGYGADNNYFYDYNGNIIDRTYNSQIDQDPALMEGTSVYKIVREFEAKAPGKTVIRYIPDNQTGTVETLYIEVKQPVTGDESRTYDIDFITDGSLEAYNNPGHPYVIREDDIINLYRHESFSDFVFLDNNGQPMEGYPYILRDNGSSVVNSTVMQSYKAQMGSNGNVFGVKTNAYGQDRIVYFVIESKWILDHADIEVADYGIYTSSKIFNDGGVLKKTVTKYQSYVSDVNECILYRYSEDSAEYQDPNIKNTTDIYNSWRDLIEDARGYVSSDYWQDETINPGEPQYELTSKYKKKDDPDHPGQKIRYDEGLKRFYYAEVDHAIFDVQLILHPLSEVTYQRVGDNWVLIEGSEVTYGPDAPTENIESATFRMNHQDVIDAYNKCPNHSGLDFTIKSTSALVELEGDKRLLGRPITDKEFAFEIYEPSTGEVKARAFNDGSGKVLFEGIHFETVGTYNYKIREVPGDDTNIVYDDTEYAVQIVVTKSGNDLVAEVYAETFKYDFTNQVKFSLPSTGGPGVLPVYFLGGLLIAGAILLMLRKNKEVDL